MDAENSGMLMITKAKLQTQRRVQKKLLRSTRRIPERGVFATYCGRKFIVLRNVCRPHRGTAPLTENFSISKGDSVLDVGTGCGALAIMAAYKGAGRVVVVDINSAAVENARQNAEMHNFSGIIDARLSDVFDAVGDEKFDVIITTLPFNDRMASDIVEKSIWDTDFAANRKFFASASGHLKPHGRIYAAQSNFGDVEKMLELADSSGFSARKIGELKDGARIFYAFEMRVKEE